MVILLWTISEIDTRLLYRAIHWLHHAPPASVRLPSLYTEPPNPALPKCGVRLQCSQHNKEKKIDIERSTIYTNHHWCQMSNVFLCINIKTNSENPQCVKFCYFRFVIIVYAQYCFTLNIIVSKIFTVHLIWKLNQKER